MSFECILARTFFQRTPFQLNANAASCRLNPSNGQIKVCPRVSGLSMPVRAQSNCAHCLFVAWFKRRKPRSQPPRSHSRALSSQRPSHEALIDLRNRTSRLSRPAMVSQLCSGSRNRTRPPTASASIARHRITARQQKRIRQRPPQNRSGHPPLRQRNDRYSGLTSAASAYALAPIRADSASRNRTRPKSSVLASHNRSSPSPFKRHKPSPPIVGARHGVPVFFPTCFQPPHEVRCNNKRCKVITFGVTDSSSINESRPSVISLHR